MSLWKQVLNFYITSSLHVALASTSLVMMTFCMLKLPTDFAMLFFVFFGTVVGYNFVKYDALSRILSGASNSRIKQHIFLSGLCFVGCFIAFLHFQLCTQLWSLFFLALTILYTIPFFPNRRNARNWAGVKIYIVTLCWVGVTLILPIIDAGLPFTNDLLIKSAQRFIFVFVLILIFEIVDLKNDDPHLKTVPQLIGVRPTKWLGSMLLIVFYCLELLLNWNPIQLQINIIIVAVMIGFLMFAKASRPKYYSIFWAEMLPIFWLILLFLANYLIRNQ